MLLLLLAGGGGGVLCLPAADVGDGVLAACCCVFLQGGGARDFVLQPLDATFTFKQLSRYGKAGVPPHWLEDSTGQH